MRTLHVDLGERSYPIYIGENLLGDARWFAPHIVGRRVAVISNETIAPLYLETLLKALQGHEVTLWCCPTARPTSSGKPCN